MGAASILHYLGWPDIGEHRELVKIVILDSPYADLTLIVKTHVWGSSILTGCAKLGLHFINKKTKQLAGLDILNFKPKEFASKCTHDVSALFLHGEQDTFIWLDHLHQNFTALKSSDKHQLVFKGTHTSKRQKDVCQRVYEFIKDWL